jgi:Outer membrane protein beta-barrel domain
MKMDVRTSVALCLLAVTATAAAQNTPQEQTVPAPQQNGPPPPPPSQIPPPAPSAQPLPPPAPQVTAPAPTPQPNVQPAPATPPLPRLPSQQYQYSPAPQSPPPPQYQYQYAPPPAPTPSPPVSPPPPRYSDGSQRSHSEAAHSYVNPGFQYEPFRFHLDGGQTLTRGANSSQLDNGWNAGFGFSWFPTSHLPLGVRVDGTYSEFSARSSLLDQATATYGTRIDNATARLYGGDVDLELDSYFSPYVRMYLLAGGGWYRQQTTYRQTNYYPGLLCDWWGCGYGYYGVDTIVARNTTNWHFAKNAGIGLEFAMGPRTAFYVEARYTRIDPNNSRSDFIPIRAGLRF